MVGSRSFTLVFYPEVDVALTRRPLLTVETTDLPTGYGTNQPMTSRTGLGSSPDASGLMRFGRRPLRVKIQAQSRR